MSEVRFTQIAIDSSKFGKLYGLTADGVVYRFTDGDMQSQPYRWQALNMMTNKGNE